MDAYALVMTLLLGIALGVIFMGGIYVVIVHKDEAIQARKKIAHDEANEKWSDVGNDVIPLTYK